MSTWVKYARSVHLPWSPGRSVDDIALDTASIFNDKEVVVTVKMDGENTTMYCDHIHARSLDSRNHPSRNWVKALHASIAHEIPKGMRICGENLYATHSIRYKNLESYFMVFSIWNESNQALSWDQTVEWCSLLDLIHVPVLYRGLWNETIIKGLYCPVFNGNEMEGYVVRVAEQFNYEDFGRSLAKYVRASHVQETDEHWMTKTVVLMN